MLRWLLALLLAASGGVIAFTPGFRLLWDMEFASARVGIVHQDGVTQWSEMGPRAPLPQWALVPDHGKLRPEVRYEKAPGHGESGFGYVRFAVSPAAAQAAYAAKLRAAGWRVELSYFEARVPEFPGLLKACIVQAVQGDNRLMLRTSDGGFGRDLLLWDHGREMKPVVNARPGGC
jgi:hypothetical protein